MAMASVGVLAAIEFVLMFLASALLGKAFVGWGNKSGQRVGFYLALGCLFFCLTFCWSVFFGVFLGFRNLVLTL